MFTCYNYVQYNDRLIFVSYTCIRQPRMSEFCMRRKRVIMVYPYQGFSGTYVKHSPLGLLYAVAGLAKEDYDIKILDTRVVQGDWQQALRALVTKIRFV